MRFPLLPVLLHQNSGAFRLTSFAVHTRGHSFFNGKQGVRHVPPFWGGRSAFRVKWLIVAVLLIFALLVWVHTPCFRVWHIAICSTWPLQHQVVGFRVYAYPKTATCTVS